MKLFKRIVSLSLLSLILAVSIADIANAAPSWTYWEIWGAPRNLQTNSPWVVKTDLPGSNIMARLKSSYTYNSRRTRVLNSRYMYNAIQGPDAAGNLYPGANMTWDTLPNGEIGYTRWYDSQYGLFLDYETQFVINNIIDSSHGRPNVVQDAIDYIDVQFANTKTNTAFLATTQVDGTLADAKSAAMTMRGGTAVPIYLNSGTTIDPVVNNDLVAREIKNLYILGGDGRFTKTAGANTNYNVIRIGGIDRQETWEYLRDKPVDLEKKKSYTFDSEGIKMWDNRNGDLTSSNTGTLGARYGTVRNALKAVLRTGNASHLINQVDGILSAYQNGIGTPPTGPNSGTLKPAIVMGCKYETLDAYFIAYYIASGRYVYQIVLPGYEDKVVDSWVNVTGADYVSGNDNWVKPGNSVSLLAESYMDNALTNGKFPTTSSIHLDVPDGHYGTSIESYYDRGPRWDPNMGAHFNLDGTQHYYRIQNTNNAQGRLRNFVQSVYNIKPHSNLGDHDYILSAYGYYQDGSDRSTGQGFISPKRLRIDGTIPKSGAPPGSYLYGGIGKLKVLQNDIRDDRSGLVTSSPYAYVFMQGSANKGPKIPLVIISTAGGLYDYAYDLNLNSHFGNVFGNMVIEVYARDNVGNEGLVSSKIMARPSPTPKAGGLKIFKYNYKDANGVKWVNTRDEFAVYNMTYLDSSTGMYPGFNHQIAHPSNVWAPINERSQWDFGISHYAAGGRNLNANKLYVKGASVTTNTSVVGSQNQLHSYNYQKALASGHGNIDTWWYDGSTVFNGQTYFLGRTGSGEKLGIDAYGPSVRLVKGDTGRNIASITLTDNESGLDKIVLTGNTGRTQTVDLTGKVQTVSVDLVDSTQTTIQAFDNVGNVTTEATYHRGTTPSNPTGGVPEDNEGFPDIYTRVNASIVSDTPVLLNGKKQMKVTATARVINPIPGKPMKLAVNGVGADCPTIDANGNVYFQDNALDYVFHVDDKTPPASGPSLTYAKSLLGSKITFGAVSDRIMPYTFKLNSMVTGVETAWRTETTDTENHASGFDHYRYDLIRLSDEKFASVTPVTVKTDEISKDALETISGFPTGKYRLVARALDFNLNRSPATQIEFDHFNLDLDMGVTAVKDIAWEKESYPIDYKTAAAKFPLGDVYKFNGAPIKIGYAINYEIELPVGITFDGYDVNYKIVDSTGSPLTMKSGGKTLAELDSSEGTHYLRQPSNYIITNNKFYLKHYLPANAEVFKSDGSKYTGFATVSMDYTLKLGTETSTQTFKLYTVDCSKSALDDLELDKQR